MTQSLRYDRRNYSPLGQINTTNIRRLVPIWSTSVMNDMGGLAAPTVYNTGSSINATAITCTHKGRQFVTVASGRGGQLASRYTTDKVPTGGSIWTFALLPE